MSLTLVQGATQVSRRAGTLYSSARLPWIIIAVGVLLRVVPYVANRALWMDEAGLALNLVNRPFLELLEPLNESRVIFQVAPFGFLWAEKLAVELLGNSEYALRLLPLLAGLVSLPLFYGVAKQSLKPPALLIALVLFAASEPLVYYASELKQYSSDVAIGLLILLLTMHVSNRGFATGWLALYSITGAVAVWFSHPAVFVLAGAGGSLAVIRVLERDWQAISRLAVVYVVWLASFGVLFALSLGELSTNPGLRTAFTESYATFPPTSLSDVQNLAELIIGALRFPGNLFIQGIVALIFLVGCLAMLLEKREKFLILLSPLLVTLVVSGLQRYPFHGRVILFLVPVVLLTVAAGAEYIREKTWSRSFLIALPVLGLLLLVPIIDSGFKLRAHTAREEIRPAMRYLRENYLSGDVLYVYYGSEPAFEYYSDQYGFDGEDYVLGIRSFWDPARYIPDLEKLRSNRRVWILFSLSLTRPVDEEQFFLTHLDSMGTRLDSFKTEGAAVYLYDLSETAALSR